MKIAAFTTASLAWDLQMPNLSETFDSLAEQLNDSMEHIKTDADSFVRDFNDYAN